MIRSMTGFGHFEMKDEKCFVRADIRSVNSRGVNVSVSLPEELTPFEADIETLVKSRLKRGNVRVSVEYERAAAPEEYSFNAELIKTYYRELREILTQLGMRKGEIDIGFLLSLPGCVTRSDEARSASSTVRECVLKVVEGALSALEAMREKEGEQIERDLRERAAKIESLLEYLEKRAPDMLEGYRKRLMSRLRKILNEMSIELKPADVARELIIFAEKSDVSEEIMRLRSHLVQLRSTLESNGSVGRKLEFIVQEMFREANTIASKVTESDMLERVVDLKGEIDRLREQVMNVE